MHKLLYLLAVSSILLSSCGDSKNSNPNVSINGLVENGTEKVYLNKFNDSVGKYVAVDSAVISDEKKYTFNTYVDSIEFLILTHKNSDKIIELIVTKNEEISLEYDLNELPKLNKIEGSEDSKVDAEAALIIRDFEELKQKATNELNALGYTDTLGRKEVIRKFEETRAEFNQKKNTFFNENPNSLGLYVFLPYLNYEEELHLIQKVEANFAEKLNGTSWHNYVKRAKDQAENYIAQKERFEREQKMQEELANRLAIGSVAPDISLPDLNGNYKSLSELRGKVVLIDFWASWCRPCRAENPNLVRAYNDYKSKGFTIFSVSLDNDKNRWEMAIQQDGLVWEHHVSDLMGWQTSVGPTYGINSIPFAVLIDKEGKIVAKNLRGDALKAKLKEILG